MQIYPGQIIGNFLGQDGKQFKIPVYQRNYEWSQEQCKKLFEDIINAAKRNRMHFCGSIVFQPLSMEKGLNISIIIDGQQRLTTIYILLKALIDMAHNEMESMLIKNTLFNINQFGTYTLDEQTKVKLKPAKDNNEQLLTLLNNEYDKIDKSCEIYRNYEFFCDLIKEQQAQNISVNDIYRGIGFLTVAVIQLDANDKAQEIFERINSTGIPLSLADKIRNYVLMTDLDQDRLYDEYWLKIEKLLPKEQLTNFFIDFLNMKLDGFTKESNAYDDFKQFYIKGKYTNESMLKTILRYATFYHAFIYGDNSYNSNINLYLKQLHHLKQTTVFLFLFHVFDDYQDGIIDDKELEKVLRFIVNYSIRRIVCEIGSNSLRGFCKSLYSRAFAIKENKEHYYDSIVSFCMQVTSKDQLPDDNTFIQCLKYNNLYRKNPLCKFLLIEIENQGKEKLETKQLTIEHIMPQNRNLSTAWQKMLGKDNWANTQEKYLHTLGNLTLTGYNSELGDMEYEKKKKKIEEVQSKVIVLYSDVKDSPVWNADSIEKRATRLANLILELFPIEEPETAITFKDPRYHEYTCDDADNATFKAINYYVLQGEQVNVTRFTEMLRSIILRLYEEDKSIIEHMAKYNEPLFDDSKMVLFTYDKDKFPKGLNVIKLGDTDIYQYNNFSASETINVIKGLLDKYEIDRNDFIYSARDKSSKK